MTIQECYKEMGGDFEGVQKRFGGVAMVKKFAIKFLSDSSFQDLEDGLKEKDAEKAFCAAHTLKGICLNPVSYTHLDVYKRQVLSHLLSVILFVR